MEARPTVLLCLSQLEACLFQVTCFYSLVKTSLNCSIQHDNELFTSLISVYWLHAKTK